ncbi:ribonuclease P/MRP protein subunit POP5 isoform X2 [Nematostella vectensis]|uniref:ribonuclease P/MRP protein subunit POP5 isoform X2 n=1 Tax=Nematostella vectensis TaxID=45351 RepID=UPI002076DE01|nr:ribonuclease P/MRP protein subunit POP5 isoform X2 [Nematostella vectensis]
MVRFKKRYFLVEVEYEDGLIDDSVQKDAMRQVVKEAVKTAFGDYGLGCIQQFLKVKYLNPVTNILFLQCLRDYQQILQTSLTFVKSINNRACMFKTLYIGAEKEKVSSLIESATKEESVLDSVWLWRRRTKALTQKTVNKEKNTDLYGDSDSN